MIALFGRVQYFLHGVSQPFVCDEGRVLNCRRSNDMPN